MSNLSFFDIWPKFKTIYLWGKRHKNNQRNKRCLSPAERANLSTRRAYAPYFFCTIFMTSLYALPSKFLISKFGKFIYQKGLSACGNFSKVFRKNQIYCTFCRQQRYGFERLLQICNKKKNYRPGNMKNT